MRYAEIFENMPPAENSTATQSVPDKWLYHATTLKRLKKIAIEGLTVGAADRTNFTYYTKYCDGKLFFSDSLEAAEEWCSLLLRAIRIKNKEGEDVDSDDMIGVILRIPYRKLQRDRRGSGEIMGSVFSTEEITPKIIQFLNPKSNVWENLSDANYASAALPVIEY